MLDSEKTIHSNLLRQRAALAKFGEFALRASNLNETLTEARRLEAEALGTELAKVLELQADGRTLTVRACVGWNPNVVGVVGVEASEDNSEGVALKTGLPMISPDIASETRYQYAAFLIDNGVKAFANVFIIGGEGRVAFGILQVDSREPRDFTADGG